MRRVVRREAASRWANEHTTIAPCAHAVRSIRLLRVSIETYLTPEYLWVRPNQPCVEDNTIRVIVLFLIASPRLPFEMEGKKIF